VDLIPNESEVEGLLALMLLQDSRALSRVGSGGELLTLDRQDRSLWNRSRIDEGLALLRKTSGTYQIQAAIAGVHARATRAEDTDWTQIVTLYSELYSLHPSPVVRLNLAVAVAMAQGADHGLAIMDEIANSGELEDYCMLHAARADMLRRLGR